MLGLDPLYVVNVGKLLAVVSGGIVQPLDARRGENRYGRESCIIGQVETEPPGIVAMVTGFDGTRRMC